jgi:Pro-kumamolisin, activation domain/Bacterial Ig-like domain (group 3)
MAEMDTFRRFSANHSLRGSLGWIAGASDPPRKEVPVRIRQLCRSVSFFPLLIASAYAQTSARALVTSAVDDAVRVPLRGNVHPMARPENDRGPAPDDLKLERLVLVLKRSASQETALERLIEDQQNKASGSYHRWLTPEQLGVQFGPAQSDVDAVTSWLRASGFEVSTVSKSRMFVEFSGSAGTVRQAFGAPIHRYVVNGEQHLANANEPTIPAALAPVVAGIDSLHNFRRQAQHHFVGQYSMKSRTLTADADPFVTVTSGQYVYYPLAPYDFATIYDLLPLWNATPTPINGTGETIAVVARTDIDPADATGFWSSFGLDGTHAPEPTLVRTYNGPNPGVNDDEAEADIDTQWSGAAAPGATINLVESASTETTDGVDLSSLYIVENNLAPVVSVSYGQCEAGMGSAGVQFYSSLWEQAAAQGMSVFVSSGDSGAAGCDDPGAPAQHGLAVNGLASTAFNAAVGGTDFNEYQTWTNYWNSTNAPVTQASAKGYIPETTWNDSCTNGLLASVQGGVSNPETNCNNATFKSLLVSEAGSGGTSTSWLKPAWQTQTPSDNARDLPDVSLFASNGFLGSFYIVCQGYTDNQSCSNLNGYGGTSVAAPAFAGIMALVDQKAGSPQGVPGLVLYKLAQHTPTAFHDVPAGSTIAVPCVTGTTNCVTATVGDAYGVLSGVSTATGYDVATGLGSVDAANLVNNWGSISFSPTTATLTLNSGSAVNIVHGAAVPVSIAVSPSAATGDAALMVSPGTPGDAGLGSYKLAAGTASGTSTNLPGGTYAVMAHYGGDTTYGGSYSAPVSVTVTPETSNAFVDLVTLDITGKVTSFQASNATYGQGYALLRVDVGDAASSYSAATAITSTCSTGHSSCPTGNVALAAQGSPLGSQTLALNNKGYAETGVLLPGSYSASASYAGDASYGPSSNSVIVSVAKAPTTATAGVASLPVQYGQAEQVALQIATTSDGIAPTGTVQFYVDGVAAGNPVGIYESAGFTPTSTQPYAWADAQSTVTFTSLGNHALTATYSGDDNYASSTSASVAVAVQQGTAIFNSWGAQGANVVVGQSATLAAQVSSLGGSGVAPTGTMTFYVDDGAVTGTPTYATSGNGLSATLPYTFATPGPHNVKVSYSGDANYSSVTSGEAQVTVAGMVSLSGTAGMTISAPGQSGTMNFTLVPNAGFTGAATVACTADATAKEASCSVTVGSSTGASVPVNLNGTSVQASVTVTTAAAHKAAVEAPVLFGNAGRIAVAGLVLLLMPWMRRRGRVLLGLVMLVLTLGLGACGGGGGSGGGSGGGGGGNTDPGTAAGTYTFQLVVTPTTGQYTQSTTVPFSVTVQ